MLIFLMHWSTRQIKMLGLSSPYILISEENIPIVRCIPGLRTYTPGTWVESIQISKGAGSVTNGLKVLLVQINSELQKAPHWTHHFS